MIPKGGKEAATRRAAKSIFQKEILACLSDLVGQAYSCQILSLKELKLLVSNLILVSTKILLKQPVYPFPFPTNM